jgi:hypothetical protein
MLFFFFFLVPVPLSVRKNNCQICQLTHSPHVLTREVQGKRETESDGKLVPETDKNMLKNKLCTSQQANHNNNNTPQKKKKKKKNRPRLQKQTPHASYVEPN